GLRAAGDPRGSSDLLTRLGIPVSKCTSLVKGWDDLVEKVRSWESRRDSLVYELDGLVLKLDDFASRGALGATAKAPRWAIAYKFPARQVTTIVTHLDLSVTRTGAVSPT